MKAKRIGQCVGLGALSRMQTTAARHEELACALQAAMPEWLECDELQFELTSRSVLYLQTTNAQARLLDQILPMLTREMRRWGVRRVLVRGKG